MVVTAVNVTREVANSNSAVQFHFCKAVITLHTAASSPVVNATVTGSWSASGDNARTAAAIAAAARRSGQALFRSQMWKAVGQDGKCEFVVRNVRLAGKSYNRSASVTSAVVAWG
jgi:hypothetical protein